MKANLGAFWFCCANRDRCGAGAARPQSAHRGSGDKPGYWRRSTPSLIVAPIYRPFDILGCGNKPAAQLYWFRDPLTARFASAQLRLEQFCYDLFEFLVLMDSANL